MKLPEPVSYWGGIALCALVVVAAWGVVVVCVVLLD
jgi:hypothetical protein